MVTLPEKRFDFNTKVQVSRTGGELSTDAGLVLVKEMMTQLDFTALAQQLVHFKDERRYYRHDNVSLLEQVVLQLIAGYHTDQATNQLRLDPIFKLVLAKASLASQASFSRFWRRCDDQTITSLQALNQAMLAKARLAANQTELISTLIRPMRIRMVIKNRVILTPIMAPWATIHYSLLTVKMAIA